MFSSSQLLPHRIKLFGRDDVIFAQAIVEAVSVFAVKEGNPAGLFAKILQDCVVFLGQNPDGLIRMAAAESQLGQHVFLLREGFGSRAIVDDVQRPLPLKNPVEGAEIVVESFARVRNVDLRVAPPPGALLVSPIVSHRGAQEDDVSEGAPEWPLEEIQCKERLPTPSHSADDCRVWIRRKEISIVPRRSGRLRC